MKKIISLIKRFEGQCDKNLALGIENTKWIKSYCRKNNINFS
jgi:hypothetical protein